MGQDFLSLYKATCAAYNRVAGKSMHFWKGHDVYITNSKTFTTNVGTFGCGGRLYEGWNVVFFAKGA